MNSPPKTIPAVPRADRAARVCLHLAFWVPLAACTYLALTPTPPAAVFRLGDIVLHAFAFTYLTFALGLSMQAPRLGQVGLVMLGYGVFIELAQSLEPARNAELKDLLVDAAGIAVGLAALVRAGGWCRRAAHRVADMLLG